MAHQLRALVAIAEIPHSFPHQAAHITCNYSSRHLMPSLCSYGLHGYTQTQTHRHTHTEAHIHTQAHTDTHIDTHTDTHTDAHTQTHTDTHTHTHMLTQAHTGGPCSHQSLQSTSSQGAQQDLCLWSAVLVFHLLMLSVGCSPRAGSSVAPLLKVFRCWI